MYIALLGRQPELSIAELEQVYGSVRWFSATTALVDSSTFDIQKLGGTQKAGKIVLDIPSSDWRKVNEAIIRHYTEEWRKAEGKITLGLSTYDFTVAPRVLQKTGLILKSKLKQSGVSLRLIPNQESTLSTATSHHNKLGLSDNKVELLIFSNGKKTLVAESTGAQNITALAARDQGRPKRDAFVGMLPPKLALMMVNMAGPLKPEAEFTPAAPRVLDPFCGTGVILQEASLLDYAVYGTDLSEKMIRFSRDNLNWLQEKFTRATNWYLHEGDAIDTQWQQPISAVVSEAYLGQPFSAPPSPSKLTEVRGNCNHIISQFLKNLGRQIESGTPVVLAVPAWKSTDGTFTHLPLISKLDDLGFTEVQMSTVHPDQLLYFRPDQVVARQLLVLKKT